MAEIRQNMSEPCEKYQFVIYVFLYDLYMDGYDIYTMYTLYIYTYVDGYILYILVSYLWAYGLSLVVHYGLHVYMWL